MRQLYKNAQKTKKCFWCFRLRSIVQKTKNYFINRFYNQQKYMETQKVLARVNAYFKRSFKADLIAGVVVGLISLPLAIAFAVASGARPEQGIYTSIIAGLVIGSLSGSRYQISGPTGAFIVILLGVVNKFGLEGLMVAGFMAGIILLILGLFKFGTVIKFMPYPVTVGFTSGIAVIIFTGQIKDLFGLKFAQRPHDFIETIKYIIEELEHGVNMSAAIIAAFTLIAFILWGRFGSKRMPPAPIALAMGIVTSLVISKFFANSLPVAALVGDIPTGLPHFKMLDLNFATIKMLMPSAVTIAMLGAIESLLSAVVADGMTGTKHNSNKELVAQGIGNIVLPFFGGIPATGAIARTATNIKNGAKTRVSSIVHSLTLLIILLAAGPYAKFIPLAALAMILIIVAKNMAEIPHFIHLLKAPRQDVFILLTTFLLTVFADLTVAVGAGVVLSSLLLVQRASHLTVEKLATDPERLGTEGSERMHAETTKNQNIIMYELAGPLFFGVAAELENAIQHRKGDTLILRMKHVNHIDASAINILESIIDRARKSNGKIFLSTLQPKIKEKLEKIGIVDRIGGGEFITASTTEALEKANKK